MKRNTFTYLVGGKAGEGVKKTGMVAARLFADKGLHIFEMDDYQSLIKGGHNFSVITTAKRRVNSHYIKADLAVSLDNRSYELHKAHIAEGGIHVYNSDLTENGEGIGLPMTSEAKKYPKPALILGVAGVAALAAAIGFDKESLKKLIESEYPHGIENNIEYANTIYDLALPKVSGKFKIEDGDGKKRPFLSGNEAIALGAASAGLSLLFAYPMTPASSILHYLAAHGKELGVATIHAENEIAVMNMAVGASFTGAKVMVASSGGGFALMQEAFSLAGMAEAPVLCALSSRPGPSTGVPTYTEQGDLNFALYQGHGEFPRIVASPGTIEEAYYLAAEMLALVDWFQTPAILLTEKHLSESRMTFEIDANKAGWAETRTHKDGDYKRYLDTPDGVSPLLHPPTKTLNKWNSYEHDELGITTEKPEMIAKMHDKRRRKGEAIIEHVKKMKTVNVFGDKGPVIYTYGSTTMSVLEALEAGGIEATVVQPVYLDPLPVWELAKFAAKDAIAIEQSSTGMFATLLREKARVKIKSEIKQYDGRPFDPAELANKIKEVL